MIIVPYRVYRKYVKEHPELFFVYGHDFYNHGFFGQAFDLHGESNTHFVCTCWKMCKTSGFFSDSDLDRINQINDINIALIKAIADGRPIIVLNKIGRGYSRMFEFAPKAYKYLMSKLEEIKHKDVKWNYKI